MSMLHFWHAWGYFTTSRENEFGKPTVWRQCYYCHRSQWWMPLSGYWSELKKRDFSEIK